MAAMLFRIAEVISVLIIATYDKRSCTGDRVSMGAVDHLPGMHSSRHGHSYRLYSLPLHNVNPIRSP